MGKFDTNIDKTPFNSSLAFLERIERRWENADEAKIKGDALTYFRCLEVIFRNTHPFFNDNVTREINGEKKELTETEDIELDVKAIERLLEGNYGGGSAGRIAASIGIFKGENECDKLRMKLVKLLFKYKITYYRIDASTWQDELKEDFT